MVVPAGDCERVRGKQTNKMMDVEKEIDEQVGRERRKGRKMRGSKGSEGGGNFGENGASEQEAKRKAWDSRGLWRRVYLDGEGNRVEVRGRKALMGYRDPSRRLDGIDDPGFGVGVS